MSSTVQQYNRRSDREGITAKVGWLFTKDAVEGINEHA